MILALKKSGEIIIFQDFADVLSGVSYIPFRGIFIALSI